MLAEINKCYKCGSKYVETPVCSQCGNIPIIDGKLAYLKDRVRLLERALVTCDDLLERAENEYIAGEEVRKVPTRLYYALRSLLTDIVKDKVQ